MMREVSGSKNEPPTAFPSLLAIAGRVAGAGAVARRPRHGRDERACEERKTPAETVRSFKDGSF